MTLDLDFIHRVYRTTILLILVAGGLVWELVGKRALLGWLLGAALSLSALAVLEWSVRRFVRPNDYSPGRMLAVTLGKGVVMFAVTVFAYVAARRGWIAILWVLPGFALPHVVIVLKLIGQRVATVGRGETGGPRQ